MRQKVLRDFGGGMLLDTPAWAIPDGYVADASNFLFDRPPMARMRRKTVNAGGLQGVSYRLGRYVDTKWPRTYTFGRLQSGTPPAASYAPAVYDWLPGGSENFLKALGALTAAPTFFAWAEPVMHQGVLLSCTYDFNKPLIDYAAVAGGFTGMAGGVTAGITVTVTAGNPLITLSGGFTGQFDPSLVQIAQPGAGNPFVYVGKIVGVPSGTSILVDPVPRVSFTGVADFLTGAALAGFNASPTPPAMITGQVLISWQNRLVAFNCYRVDTLGSAGPAVRLPQTFWWTCGPDEKPTTNPNATGIMPLMQTGWEPNNYDQIGSARPITGAALATNANSILIFTDSECFLLSGYLTTQSSRSAGSTWDTNRLSSSIGCAGNNSIVDTPYGVVWASAQGVYAFDGRIRPLLEDRMARYWQRAFIDKGYNVHGAAYVNGHYIVSVGVGSTATNPNREIFICELRGRRWGKLTGHPLDVMHAIADPSPFNPRVYALGYWVTNAESNAADGFQRAAPTIHDITTIFQDTDDGGADSNGQTFTGSLLTGSQPDDAANRKQYRAHRIGYTAEAPGGTPVSCGTLNILGGIDSRAPNDVGSGLGLPSAQPPTQPPTDASIQLGMVQQRALGYQLTTNNGLRRFELQFIETYGDTLEGDLMP